jgi:hypothetical protein
MEPLVGSMIRRSLAGLRWDVPGCRKSGGLPGAYAEIVFLGGGIVDGPSFWTGRKNPAGTDGSSGFVGVALSVVAGTGFEPVTFRL